MDKISCRHDFGVHVSFPDRRALDCLVARELRHEEPIRHHSFNHSLDPNPLAAIPTQGDSHIDVFNGSNHADHEFVFMDSDFNYLNPASGTFVSPPVPCLVSILEIKAQVASVVRYSPAPFPWSTSQAMLMVRATVLRV
jgi:hypothetical protein